MNWHLHNLLVENSLEIISIAALPSSDFQHIKKILHKNMCKKTLPFLKMTITSLLLMTSTVAKIL